VLGPLRPRPWATRLDPAVTWNFVVLVGLGVTLASVAIGYRARQAELSSLRARYRWAVRLALGYAGLLFVGVAVSALRFAMAAASDDAVPEQKTVLLAACLAAALNLVLGFLLFGMAPTLVAFMLARRVEKREESGPSG
jgi:hypothetical protein